MKWVSGSKKATCRQALAGSAGVEILEPRRLLTAYYDNASAASNGAGTAASPWNSLSSISNYTGFHSGDVVNLTGTFSNQTMTLNSADAGVTITSSATSPAKIVEPASFGSVSAITVNTSNVSISNLQLTGPGISANSNSYFGIFFNNAGPTQFNGATVNNVIESGFVFAGLEISGTTAGFTNVSVTNSNFSNNQVSGIVVAGSSSIDSHVNLTINNCIASYNAGFAVWWNANHAGSNQNGDNGGIFLTSVDGAVVEHCQTIGDCYKSSGAVGTWACNATGVVFEYDESADSMTTLPGSDGDGFDFDHGVSDSIMQYDYSHGNHAAAYLICAYSGLVNDTADTIRYCISDDDALDGGPAISVYGYSMNLMPHSVLGANIYDNTVLVGATNASAMSLTALTPTAASYCTVNLMNNLFYSTGTSPLINFAGYTPSSSNIIFKGNDYYAPDQQGTFSVAWGPVTYTSLAAWRAATGEEMLDGASGLSVDPQLVNETVSDLPVGSISNLQLGVNSPLRGAGVNLAAYPFSVAAPFTSYSPYNLTGSAWNALGTQDYFGNMLTTAGSHDIGAHQASALLLSGSSLALQEDGSAPHTLDINSTTYNLAGIYSVVIIGASGSQTVSFDFMNGPLTNTAGPLSQYGMTLIAGSGSNSLTSLNSAGSGGGGMPIYFVPGVGRLSSLNTSVGTITIPAGNGAGITTATFSSIRIAAAAEVIVASPVSNQSNRTVVVVTSSLTIAGTTDDWTGMLDLGSNDLVVKSGSLSTLNNQIAQGSRFNWQPQDGIVSSAAANDTMHLTALGVIQNSINGNASGPALYTTFDSVSVLSTDILIKYTDIGDANLDGVVDGSDYSHIDNAAVNGLTGWFSGDFNYDGVIDGDDYTLMDNAFNLQL